MMLLNKDLKDMNEEGVYSGPDPLANARKDLDFAALAAGAPSVKSILFKAQTMGPLPRTRPGGKTAAGIGAGLLAVALLAAPWIPLHSSILSLQMGFEDKLSRREASKLFAGLLENEPHNTLLSASFTAQPGGEDVVSGPDGHLRVKATAFNTGSTKLEERLRQLVIIHGPGGLEPMFSQDAAVETTRWISPAGLLIGRLKHEETPYVGAQPAGSPALSAVRHSEQIASGLQGALSNDTRRVEVSACRFLDPAVRSEVEEAGSFSFVLDAWPAALAVRVEPWADLSGDEQQALRDDAEQFVAQLGLSRPVDGADGLIAAADLATPIVVSVVDSDGRYDAYLSARLQALIEQPSIEQLREKPVDVDQKVNDAMSRLLPRYQSHIVYDHEEYAWTHGYRLHVYNVRVELQGRRSGASDAGDSALDEARKELDKEVSSSEW